MLYKGKNKDRTDFLLDRWLLLSSLLIPLGMFVLRTRPVIIQTVPLRRGCRRWRRPVRNSGGGLATAASAEVARRAAYELAQAGTAGA